MIAASGTGAGNTVTACSSARPLGPANFASVSSARFWRISRTCSVRGRSPPQDRLHFVQCRLGGRHRHRRAQHELGAEQILQSRIATRHRFRPRQQRQPFAEGFPTQHVAVFGRLRRLDLPQRQLLRARSPTPPVPASAGSDRQDQPRLRPGKPVAAGQQQPALAPLRVNAGRAPPAPDARPRAPDVVCRQGSRHQDAFQIVHQQQNRRPPSADRHGHQRSISNARSSLGLCAPAASAPPAGPVPADAPPARAPARPPRSIIVDAEHHRWVHFGRRSIMRAARLDWPRRPMPCSSRPAFRCRPGRAASVPARVGGRRTSRGGDLQLLVPARGQHDLVPGAGRHQRARKAAAHPPPPPSGPSQTRARCGSRRSNSFSSSSRRCREVMFLASASPPAHRRHPARPPGRGGRQRYGHRLPRSSYSSRANAVPRRLPRTRPSPAPRDVAHEPDGRGDRRQRGVPSSCQPRQSVGRNRLSSASPVAAQCMEQRFRPRPLCPAQHVLPAPARAAVAPSRPSLSRRLFAVARQSQHGQQSVRVRPPAVRGPPQRARYPRREQIKAFTRARHHHPLLRLEVEPLLPAQRTTMKAAPRRNLSNSGGFIRLPRHRAGA